MKYKLLQISLNCSTDRHLSGSLQMDEAYIADVRSGKRGCGAESETPFIAAVSTTVEGKPNQIIPRRVVGFRTVTIAKLAGKALAGWTQAVTDALACFTAVTTAGCKQTHSNRW